MYTNVGFALVAENANMIIRIQINLYKSVGADVSTRRAIVKRIVAAAPCGPLSANTFIREMDFVCLLTIYAIRNMILKFVLLLLLLLQYHAIIVIG